ncbi:MAG: hypothetical protein M3M91_08980 [Thermoproteota archaeon]|nr:hypothetical protein [Thermoproteota archaeon]
MWTRQELKNFPSTADGNRKAGSAVVVGSNPTTRSISFNLVNYAIVQSFLE